MNSWQCYKARQIAQKMIKGTLEEHYGKVRRCLEEQMSIDHIGSFIFQTDLDETANKSIFKRLYVGYSLLRNGFKQCCKPIIGLDGTFFKLVIGGALLAAIGKDNANKMFHIT